ncbi:uncharacterized protein [Ptychodera flava]|uniref:uncharacterized protein n=1 Tax=Ptychodera flava TaxID=63121 RepID=UPI003969F43C
MAFDRLVAWRRTLLLALICLLLSSSSILFLWRKGTTVPAIAKSRGHKSRDTLQDEIRRLYPWMIRSNNLPNFFTRQFDPKVGKQWPSDETYAYGNCTIVFVHNQKSGGTTTKSCLNDLMKREGDPLPGPANNLNAGKVYSTILKRGHFEVSRTSFMGDSTFSICEFAQRPCAYFTVMRDPLERVISSYNMCRASRQPQCVMRDIHNMTVNDWAVHQGSFFFHQLLVNPEFFTNVYTNLVDELRGPDDPSLKRISPWWRNKLILDHLMNDKQMELALDYVLANLESWFAVVGLTAEYDTNFRLFERVFKLPFYKLCVGRQKNLRRDYHGLTGGEANITKEEAVKTTKRKLSSDPEVMRALHFDIQIYKKMEDIFKRQVLAFYEKKFAENK